MYRCLVNGQSIRLVGDNENWMLKVHDERIDHVGHLQHAFASAVIVNELILIICLMWHLKRQL
jgi:hypothetical protein